MLGTSLRCIVGSAPARGSVVELSLAIIDAAWACGFSLKSHKASRSPTGSKSRYIELQDEAGRVWCIRVSDHYRPKSSPHDAPHFDLVSLDGTSGLTEATTFLADAASGAIGYGGKREKRRGKRGPMKRQPNHKRFAKGRASI